MSCVCFSLQVGEHRQPRASSFLRVSEMTHGGMGTMQQTVADGIPSRVRCAVRASIDSPRFCKYWIRTACARFCIVTTYCFCFQAFASEPADSTRIQHIAAGQRFLNRQLLEIAEASLADRRHISSMMARCPAVVDHEFRCHEQAGKHRVSTG